MVLTMRRYVFAAVTGALLAALLTGLAGSLGPHTSVHLSRSLWADYLALAGATGLSVIAVYGITAFCMSVCLLVAGCLRARKAPVPVAETEPESAQPEEAALWPS